MTDDTASTLPETPPEGSEGRSGPENASQRPSGDGTAANDTERERGEDGKLLSREAATYRRRLREVEAERDTLREQRDRMQRAEVERLAQAAGLAVPEDVWNFGASLDTLRGEDGSIDGDTVKGAVDAILKNRPGLQAVPVGIIGVGRGASAAGPMNRQPVGLSQLLKPGA